MIYATTITKSGQITLPKRARELMNVDLGGRVIVDVDKKTGRATLAREQTDEEFYEYLDSFTTPKAERTLNKLRRMSSKEREQYYKDLEAKRWEMPEYAEYR